MHTGKHLKSIFDRKLPVCSEGNILRALQIRQNYSNANFWQTCIKTKFAEMLQKFAPVNAGSTTITISFQDPEVEFYGTYVNYDLQSLVGEIGGVLGLTLGASGFSLIQFLIDFISALKWKK